MKTIHLDIALRFSDDVRESQIPKLVNSVKRALIHEIDTAGLCPNKGYTKSLEIYEAISEYRTMLVLLNREKIDKDYSCMCGKAIPR